MSFYHTKGHKNTSPSPLSPPLKGGNKKGKPLSLPSPLAGEGKGEGYLGTNTISAIVQ